MLPALLSMLLSLYKFPQCGMNKCNEIFFFYPAASFRRSSRLSAAVLPQPSPSSSSSSSCLSTRSVTRQSLTSVQTPGRSAAPLLHTPAERLLTPKKTPAKAQKSQPGTPQLSRSTTSPQPACSPPSVTEEVSKVSPAVVCQAPETSACLSFTLSPCGTPTPAPASSPPTTVEARGSACRSAQTSIVEVKKKHCCVTKSHIFCQLKGKTGDHI